jgi:hypothetical protein
MNATEDKPIEQRAQGYYNLVFDNETRALLTKAEGGDEEAYERLQEMPCAITRYATYHQEERTEWHVELAWGGPAARLVVMVDECGEVLLADFLVGAVGSLERH